MKYKKVRYFIEVITKTNYIKSILKNNKKY